MSNSKTRILLVIDFTRRNFPSALYALQQWGPYVNDKKSMYETIIGVATSQKRSDKLNEGGDTTVETALKTIKEYCRAPAFVVWDGLIDRIVDDVLKNNRIVSKPVFSGFNYGSIVNKGLLLAHVMGCQYLIRVDPGTLPPRYSFDTVIKKHTDFIKHHSKVGKTVVVSRGYEGRIAVRDFYSKTENLLQHHELIEDMTKVNIYAQVTGGALFTSEVPGVPAVPFRKTQNGDLTLVWASDDGFYQLITKMKNGSMRLGGADVPRFVAVGKEKMSFEYYRGISGMVLLSSLIQGSNLRQATKGVDEFLKRLKPMLDAKKCQKNDEKDFQEKYNKKLDWSRHFVRKLVAEDAFLKEVSNGWKNYNKLRKNWLRISNLLARELPNQIRI